MAQGAAIILCSLLSIAALLVAQRRAAGALAAPLGPWTVIFTATIAAGLAGAVRLLWRPISVRADLAARWTPTAALALLGASLWLPGTNLWAMAGFWAIVIAEESWLRRAAPRRWTARKPSAEAVAVAERETAAVESLAPPPSPEEILADAEQAVSELREAPPPAHPKLAGPHYAPPRPSPPQMCDPPHAEPSAPHFGLPNKAGEDAAAGEEPEEQLVQQLTRAKTADGADVLRGSLYAAFPIGGRAVSIHVAFCPPFEERPRIEFRQTGGPAARIKLAQLLAFGARFDIKLPAPAQGDETIALDISASFP
jgi:hypothetical protein